MTADEQFAHSLKMQYGLGPGEPTKTQLAAIKAAITRIRQSGRLPTEQDWIAAVASACLTMGQWKYAGIDNSDLNTLLALALQAAGGRGQ